VSGEVASPGNRPRRNRLSAQVEVHDRQQLELRLHYLLSGPSTAQRYTVDSYIFIPKNVGVNRGNYDREQFYADVTSLMRLEADRLPLEELADPSCRASPLSGFTAALEAFRSAARPPPSRPVVVHVKLYAHLFAGGVKSEVKRLRRRLAEVVDPGDGWRFEQKLGVALSRMRRALVAFRNVRSALWPFEEMAHHSLRDGMRNADEYMSLSLEEQLSRLDDALERSEALPGTGFTGRCRARVREVAVADVAYRRKYGYLTLTDEDRGDYFSYRSSQLKKTVQQALYLDPRSVQADSFQRNAVGAVAAALAATWAVAAQVPGSFAQASGNAKLALLALPVLAYVAKDRIKAVTGEWLSKRLRRFDHAFELRGEALATLGLGALRARIGETMCFLRIPEVPADVIDLRLSQRTVRTSEIATEEVIHHRKSVTLRSEDEAAKLPDGYSVRDILRLNVRHFLVRLDEPIDEARYFDWRRETFAAAELPKVYHLNVVVKTRREWDNGVSQEQLDRLRVVLNKEGIVRVELVESRTGAYGPPGPQVGAGPPAVV
jgi:hypothetical protein